MSRCCFLLLGVDGVADEQSDRRNVCDSDCIGPQGQGSTCPPALTPPEAEWHPCQLVLPTLLATHRAEGQLSTAQSMCTLTNMGRGLALANEGKPVGASGQGEVTPRRCLTVAG